MKVASTLTGALLLMPWLATFTVAETQRFDTDLIAEKLDLYFRDYLEPMDLVMATVALSIQGKEIFNYQMGLALEGIEANNQTQYRIGSITKTFTATMIFQLIDQGLLTLDTLLADFYPEMPNADLITIQQLLQHQSGLKSLTDLDTYWDYFLAEQTKDQHLDRLAGDEFLPEFSPGNRTQYSNTNYVLLGYIVEDVSGLTYAEYLDQNIAVPLNLTRTAVFRNASAEENIAISFLEPRWTVDTNQTHWTVPGGAGSLMGTSSDLIAFYRGLFHTNEDGDSLLLSATSLSKMTNFTAEEGMGMGVFYLPLFGWEGIAHNGGIDHFSSLAVYFPAQDVTFAYISNGAVEAEGIDPLASIFSIVMDPDSFELPIDSDAAATTNPTSSTDSNIDTPDVTDDDDATTVVPTDAPTEEDFTSGIPGKSSGFVLGVVAWAVLFFFSW